MCTCVFVTGVVSSKSYDDVDEQALHRMTKERVEWSTQEDSMVGPAGIGTLGSLNKLHWL